MLQAELKILGGKHQGKAIPLTTKKFLVGRNRLIFLNSCLKKHLSSDWGCNDVFLFPLCLLMNLRN